MGNSRRPSRPLILLTLAAAWLVVTVALSAWWWVHGLKQIQVYRTMSPLIAADFESQHRMILWEGLTLVLLLLAGGGSLFVLIFREFRRNAQVREFFATVTHEIKTPLASLRLQAEALREDLVAEGRENTVLVDRLLSDASRLELQLDNALILATARDSDQIHLESVRFSDLVFRVQSSYAELKIILNGDVRVQADRRAIESVLKNLIQNSRVHGQATELEIQAQNEGGMVRICLEDNGQGFKGDREELGKLFHRHTSQSGSGIGLHLCRILISRMEGTINFAQGVRGFRTEIWLKEGRR